MFFDLVVWVNSVGFVDLGVIFLRQKVLLNFFCWLVFWKNLNRMWLKRLLQLKMDLQCLKLFLLSFCGGGREVIRGLLIGEGQFLKRNGMMSVLLVVEDVFLFEIMVVFMSVGWVRCMFLMQVNFQFGLFMMFIFFIEDSFILLQVIVMRLFVFLFWFLMMQVVLLLLLFLQRQKDCMGFIKMQLCLFSWVFKLIILFWDLWNICWVQCLLNGVWLYLWVLIEKNLWQSVVLSSICDIWSLSIQGEFMRVFLDWNI